MGSMMVDHNSAAGFRPPLSNAGPTGRTKLRDDTSTLFPEPRGRPLIAVGGNPTARVATFGEGGTERVHGVCDGDRKHQIKNPSAERWGFAYKPLKRKSQHDARRKCERVRQLWIHFPNQRYMIAHAPRVCGRSLVQMCCIDTRPVKTHTVSVRQ